jgi:hypothetical protein
MLIESDSYELLLEYCYPKYLKEDSFRDYLEGKKSIDITDSIENIDLFDSGFKVCKIESIKSIKSDGIYWIDKLTADDKKILKKESVETITLKKLDKSLLPQLEKELNFKSKLQEWTSYQEIIEEEYLFTLGGITRSQTFQTLPFMLSINDMSKFYKILTDDEMQLILSLVFSKALKVKNEKLAKTVLNIDKTIKNSNGRINQKNIWGVKIVKSLK